MGDWGSASCWKPGTLQPGHFRSVLAGQRFLALSWALTTKCPQNLVTVLFYPIKCLVTKLLFRFVMWVKCGASDDFFKKGPNSHTQVSPLSNDERAQVCDLCLLGVQL